MSRRPGRCAWNSSGTTVEEITLETDPLRGRPCWDRTSQDGSISIRAATIVARTEDNVEGRAVQGHPGGTGHQARWLADYKAHSKLLEAQRLNAPHQCSTWRCMRGSWGTATVLKNYSRHLDRPPPGPAARRPCWSISRRISSFSLTRATSRSPSSGRHVPRRPVPQAPPWWTTGFRLPLGPGQPTPQF